MIHEFKKPIPCNTPLGEAYGIYMESSGMFENDVWTCVLCENGEVKHFNTSQITIHKNATFDIKYKPHGKK
jgi:hypothetical protein